MEEKKKRNISLEDKIELIEVILDACIGKFVADRELSSIMNDDSDYWINKGGVFALEFFKARLEEKGIISNEESA